jgi:RNA-directed DNA polymerase
MTTGLEPKDKLDTVASAGVNGPEDDVLDWMSVNWRQVERDVQRLRQRIFTASREGDLKKVRNLQKLMLRSHANTLVSVRRVAQRNTGRLTPGIDGQVALTDADKASLVLWLQREAAAWRAWPVKRVYIPKANGKQRPLGIPVIVDRALQAVVLGALEPEWEARFEPKSYGFRPGRGCQDAKEAIFTLARRGAKRVWILDADLSAAFDRINHDRLLAALGTFPARGRIRQWLKAGVVEDGRFAPTEEGTPQGGVVSPLLLNVALHGMEQAAGVRYRTTGVGHTVPGCPAVVRYADDLVALCHTREQAEQVKAQLAVWLAPRGLAFNEDKTRIVHLNDGFDFLGFNVRRYRNDKLLIKPSKAAVRRFRNRLRTELRALRGAPAVEVVIRLNPILRGWAAYYRSAVSKHVFNQVDDYLWWLLYRWAKRRHQNKPKKWITARYFGAFHPNRRAQWLFGDRESGAYVTKLAWVQIIRHQMVDGAASPDDPDLAYYWERRRRGRKPPLDREGIEQLRRQRGRCPLCGEFLLYADHEPQHPDEWVKWFTGTRKAIRRQAVTAERNPSTDDHTASHLVHTHCAKRQKRS